MFLVQFLVFSVQILGVGIRNPPDEVQNSSFWMQKSGCFVAKIWVFCATIQGFWCKKSGFAVKFSLEKGKISMLFIKIAPKEKHFCT